MSNDLFKGVNFTAGQEVRAADLVNSQKFLASRLMDQIFDQLTPGPNTATDDPEFRSELGADSATSWAYALSIGGGNPKQGSTNAKVKIGAGTLLQKIAAMTGNEAKLLPYTFDDTLEVTISNGDVAARVDLVQMKLEWETGDSQSRVFSQEAIYATLDLGALLTNLDTVVRAKNRGSYGNNVQVRVISGGSAAYTEAGNLVTLTFVDGVTTVADIENLIVSDSNVIEIDGPGTPANVLADPDDVLVYTTLADGVDQILISQSFDMQSRVKAIISVVEGTPDASPDYPSPTAGYVPICAVVVPAGYAHTSPFAYAESATVAVIHDVRMPIGVKVVTVKPPDFMYNDNTWTLLNRRRGLSSIGISKTLSVPATLAERPASSLMTFQLGGWNLGNDTIPISYPISLDVGMIITGYILKCNKASDATNTLTAELEKWVSGANTVIDTQTNLENAPGERELVGSGLSEEILAGGSYALRVFQTDSSPSAVDSVYDLEVRYKTADTGDVEMFVACPIKKGRLLALDITAVNGNVAAVIASLTEPTGFSGGLADVVDLVETGATAATHHAGRDYVEDNPMFSVGPVITGNGTHGPPIWCNGKRTYEQARKVDGEDAPMSSVGVLFTPLDGMIIHGVTFYVAEGL